MNTHVYMVTCQNWGPVNSMRNSAKVFLLLQEAEEHARMLDEIHDAALCATRHNVFQVNFVEIPREGE